MKLWLAVCLMCSTWVMAQSGWDDILKKAKLPPLSQWSSEVVHTTIEAKNFQIVPDPSQGQSEKSILLEVSNKALVEKKSIAVSEAQIRALEKEGISRENISWSNGQAKIVTFTVLPFFRYLFCDANTCRQKDILSEKFVHLHESIASRLKLDEQNTWILSGLSFVSWAFVSARVALIAKSSLPLSSLSSYVIKPLIALTGSAPLGMFILAERQIKSSDRLRKAYRHLSISYYDQGSDKTSLEVLRPDPASNIYSRTTGTYMLPKDVRIGDFASKLKWMLTDSSISRFKVNAEGFENHQVWAIAPQSYSSWYVGSTLFPGSMRLMLRMLDGLMNKDSF